MIANDCSLDRSVISPEIETFDRDSATDDLLCRLCTGSICSPCQYGCKSTACYRRKLTALVYDPDYAVWKMRACHAIQHYAADC